MSRGIGHNEATAVCSKKPVGHVDGDALFALSLQTIHQQRQVHLFALGTVQARIALQAGQLVVKDRLALEQQASNQRALAIIHAAAGNEAQQPFIALLVQKGCDVFGLQIAHQK